MKKKTKWTRIAVSGPTIDGRNITPQQIDEMAASYDPAVYKANIWVEHIRGVHPDSEFGNKGNVLALKAEDFTINGQKQRALYGMMEVGTDLQKMNEKDQKKGASIEIAPNFAQTGKAYLRGLGVTDSPASLGTEAMQFNIYARQATDSIFSDVIEFDSFEYSEDPVPSIEQKESAKSFFKEIFADLFAQKPKEEPKPEPVTEPTQVFNQQALLDGLEKFSDKIADKFDAMAQANTALQTQFNSMKTEFDALKQTPAVQPKQEFVAGTGTTQETDC